MTGAARRYFYLPAWAPAFAGERFRPARGVESIGGVIRFDLAWARSMPSGLQDFVFNPRAG